ncbi:MAG: radical SAM protein [Deltaproteobacteria bacterium]|nr:radical SAM protein [Deltaproteobacteria bacterium]
MDVIVIADSGSVSVSGTNKLKLMVDGHVATIQAIENFLDNNGRVIDPVIGDGVSSWASSLKLNGIFLYSYLFKQGFDVALINNYYDERDHFIQMLTQSPKAVVISTSFILNKETLNQIAHDIKSLAPGIFIIAGGQFVHLSKRIKDRMLSEYPIMDIFSSNYLFLEEGDEPPVDLYIISTTGESILATALKMLKAKGKVNELPDTAIYQGKRYIFGKEMDTVEKKGGVTVDWANVPQSFFQSGVVPMQASYGCPYDCAFCNFMKDRRLMGIKPLDNLISELKTVEEKGARYVWFVDDNFRLGKNDLKTVCRQFIDHGIKVKWKSFIRVSALKDMDMRLLKEAGCIEVQFGLESADQTLLTKMNKKANPELYAQVVKKVMEAGINCSCYFVFGFPGETKDTIKRTSYFIKELEHYSLDGYIYFTMFPFIIAPLSPISELKNAQCYGLKGSMYDWEHNTMNAKEAIEYALKSFFELKTSGIIYHGDNLDMLLDLDSRHRKEFIAKRHKMAKMAATAPIHNEDLIKSFKDVLRNH